MYSFWYYSSSSKVTGISYMTCFCMLAVTELIRRSFNKLSPRILSFYIHTFRSTWFRDILTEKSVITLFLQQKLQMTDGVQSCKCERGICFLSNMIVV